MVTCDTVKACLEGDYAGWTKIWESDIFAGAYGEYLGVTAIDEDNDTVYLRCSTFSVLLTLSTGEGKTVQDLSGSSTMLEPKCHSSSLRSKYVAYIKYSIIGGVSYQLVIIYKNGDQFQGIVVDTEPSISGHVAAVSPSGKYIIVYNVAHSKLVCYEGA